MVCKRLTACYYIAVDSYGRGFMLSGLERTKYIYLLNYDKDVLSVSEPILCKFSNGICYDVANINSINALSNIAFASIEAEYLKPNEENPTGVLIKKLYTYTLNYKVYPLEVKVH